MKKVVLGLILGVAVWSSFVSGGFAQCTHAGYLGMLHSANNLRDIPSPQYLVPDGPTYGCWPTGAICGYNCNERSWACLAYCLLLGVPNPYACKAGCQYVCVYQSGTFFFTCRDIIYIGCACDPQPRNCPEAG